ncbi:MAG: hypothetical protein GX572_00150 [Clostridia bacterium]|nr:hypothetical protein [Clostridia bacterium]
MNEESENLSRYDKYQHAGVDIYIDKQLRVRDELMIRANPQFPLLPRTYSVYGVS